MSLAGQSVGCADRRVRRGTGRRAVRHVHRSPVRRAGGERARRRRDDDGAPAASPAQVQEAFFRATFQVDGPPRQGRRPRLRGRDPRRARDDERVPARRARSAARDRTVHAGQEPRVPARSRCCASCGSCVAVVPTCAACSCRSSCRRRCGAAACNAAGREVLARVCAALGVSAYEVVQMEALLRMQQAARQPPEARPARRSRRAGVRSAGRDAHCVATPRSRRRIAG